ncbi:hypothetical protein [Streptosporangium canum]|uniref:hypothetical protein n=1 Tax=Streptosporangium canum TaxID=324952 RepID=UPI0037B68E10
MIHITYSLTHGTCASEEGLHDEVGMLLSACGFEWRQFPLAPGEWMMPNTAYIPVDRLAIEDTVKHLRKAGIAAEASIDPWIDPEHAAYTAERIASRCPRGYQHSDIALGDILRYAEFHQPENFGPLPWGRVGRIDHRTVDVFWGGTPWAYTRIILDQVIEIRRPIDRNLARLSLAHRALFLAPVFTSR